MICAVGVVDDLYELDAITKLAGQVLAVGVMVVQGIQLYWLPLPGGVISPSPAQLAVLTAGILLVSCNAVNFVDGLDGLAAGVTAIGATAFFTYSYLLNVEQNLDRATTSTLITVALAGACLGFLPHNFFPARVFMGDSGALLIGLMLAASTISLTGQMDPNAVPYEVGGSSLLPALLPLVLPIAVLAIPALDLTMAYVRRTKAGRSPFAADKLHLHHRLMQRGHSHRRAVLLMYLWTALIAYGVVVLGPGPVLVDGPDRAGRRRSPRSCSRPVCRAVPGNRSPRSDPRTGRDQTTHSRGLPIGCACTAAGTSFC